MSDDWQQPGGVRLRYVYDPLPEGVLPRFIVRTHLLSEKQPRWRGGVVLTDARAKALVRRGANAGLKLAAYQILKPGGKAISKHPSLKEGFNEAQKELENLIRDRQPKKQTRQSKDREFEPHGGKRQSDKAGITVIVQGDYIEGEKLMSDDHSINIGGNVTNSQVAQTMLNCANTIQQQAPGDQKDLLQELHDRSRNY
ncbi:MAG: hypothetical protein CMJ64_09100 [Planctomycetaceae bacterium]|nr:hypothetical protein [Planctomycetaceae bacterium]